MAETELITSKIDTDEEFGIGDDEIIPSAMSGLESESVILPPGRALWEEHLYSITAAEPSHLCFLIGMVGCGKTTLITSIYHSFLTGDWKDQYYFAGSRTLWTFEELAFYVRTRSMCSSVRMARTSGAEDPEKFLHIRFQQRATGQIENLMLADYSGEQYEAVSANIKAARDSFQVLRAADCIAVLLDGKKLVKSRNRLSELQKAIQLLHTFRDSDLISRTAKIIIVISKYDLLIRPDVDGFEKFCGTIFDQIQKQLPDLSTRCRLRKVAAMPKRDSKLPIGYGVRELFENFLRPMKSQYQSSLNQSSMTSQFNLWGRRTLYGK